mgnify:CR=1 FL=1|tara:strand:- start:349 stop:1173 length:825 start_codon:yes stop_codon:yes gene_type:complete
MNLWIITVNFGDTTATNSLIESLFSKNNNCSIKVGIADNATSATSVSQLKAIIDQSSLDIRIFPNNKNLYYWPAVKKTINNLKDQIGSYPDWVIVCNNDVIFSDKLFFQKLLNVDIKKYPIIGPSIINSNKFDSNPFMKKPLTKIQKLFWRLYFSSYSISIILLIINKLLKSYKFNSKLKNINGKNKVYAVHGSTILFSNYFFENGGYFDDNFEMYGEELTVAEIAKKLNFPITYYPELKVTHLEHNTTKRIDRRLLFRKAKKSYKYFISNYFK